MNLGPSLIREVLEALPTGTTKARVADAVLATMNPAQRWVMERWNSYACEACGHTMITNTKGAR